MEVNKIIATLVAFYMVTVAYCQMTGTGNSPITALGQNPLAGGYGNFQRPTPVYPGGRGMTPGLSANRLTLLRLLNPEFGGETSNTMMGMMFCHTCIRERNTLCMRLYCVVD